MPQVAKIPEDADPAVRFILAQVRGQRPKLKAEVAAELGHDVIRKWHYYSHRWGPRIGIVRRVLNALGYDLAIVPLSREAGAPQP